MNKPNENTSFEVGVDIGMIMKGLRIRKKYSGHVLKTSNPQIATPEILIKKAGLSDFSRYFSSIKSYLSSYYWIIESDGLTYNFPKEWNDNQWYDEETDETRSKKLDEFNSDILVNHSNYVLTKPCFIPKYCDYFLDDWCDIFGFEKIPEHDFWKIYCSYISDRQKLNAFLNDVCTWLLHLSTNQRSS
ncbi:MAG: hypothetical protein GY749_01995 [Desulfobacteraceae bacterium]|nr:hypothetical protein [Desulfobacteraceae bacterium]